MPTAAAGAAAIAQPRRACRSNARRGAITKELEAAQFRSVMQQGDTVRQDRCNHPEQEQESRGERHRP